MNLKNLKNQTILIMALVGGFLVARAEGAPLDTRIQNLQVITTSVTTDVPAAFNRLISQTNLDKGPLIVGGVVQASSGTVINWPVSYVASTFSVSALQFDVPIPSSFTVVSVVTGPAALAAGKSVTSQLTGNVERVLVVGVNQTVIPTGVVAIFQFNLGAVPKRFYPLSMDNPVVSDPLGNSLIASGISGTVQIK